MNACPEARESDQHEDLAASPRRKLLNFSRSRQESPRRCLKRCLADSSHPYLNLIPNRLDGGARAPQGPAVARGPVAEPANAPLLLRRATRNFSQDRFEDQIALIAPIVAIGVLIQVGLQVLLADRMVHTANPALDKAPEALHGVGMNIAPSHRPWPRGECAMGSRAAFLPS